MISRCFPDPLDRSLACVDRDNLRAASRGFNAQVAQSAAQVENATMHEKQGNRLERVQRMPEKRLSVIDSGAIGSTPALRA